jgi:hypothetical protein
MEKIYQIDNCRDVENMLLDGGNKRTQVYESLESMCDNKAVNCLRVFLKYHKTNSKDSILTNQQHIFEKLIVFKQSKKGMTTQELKENREMSEEEFCSTVKNLVLEFPIEKWLIEAVIGWLGTLSLFNLTQSIEEFQKRDMEGPALFQFWEHCDFSIQKATTRLEMVWGIQFRDSLKIAEGLKELFPRNEEKFAIEEVIMKEISSLKRRLDAYDDEREEKRNKNVD